MSRLRTLMLPVAFVALAACAREKKEPTKEDSLRQTKPAAPAVRPSAETSPAALVGMPGPIHAEHGLDQAVTPKPNMKNAGRLGELLEGDVYFLRLVALHPCEGPEATTGSGPTSRIAVGAEVEITAKTALNVNPRDATLNVGGIIFNGSVDVKRKLKGCTPLVAISRLKKDEVARGVILFDIPVAGPGSELDKLGFTYHPTRFGGSFPVFVHSKSGE